MVMALMLKASSDILNKAKEQLLLRKCTPLQLANELGLAVQLVENLLNGEMVDRNTYDLVCAKLNISINPFDGISSENLIEDLPSQDKDMTSIQSENIHYSSNYRKKNDDIPVVANAANGNLLLKNIGSELQNGNNNSTDSLPTNFDEIIQAIRQNIAPTLTRQCDRLKVININHPLFLHDLYTDINVFTSLPSSQYLDLNETFANIPPEQYDRASLNKLYPSTIPANQALEESLQILLVGGLGIGKTTLLKYWALNCIEGKILSKYLPIFLPLRSFISFNNLDRIDNLLCWIKKQLFNYGWLNGLLDETSGDRLLEQLLDRGDLLLLWDDLDDLPKNYRTEIVQQILSFSDRYPQNRMVVATRNPIYAHLLESFKISEIAPFQTHQVTKFASKWFQTTCTEPKQKNTKFQQLIATNQPLAEIASIPLFLTYLCVTFNNCEYIKSNFYQEILNLLLTKWEETKCLTSEHNDHHFQLSTSHKLDLLSYVAIVALDRRGYVWQNLELEEDFQDCLKTSRTLSNPLSNLEIDRDRLFHVLKWQHSVLVECAKGIHTLRHTTLHDYLAAYRLANSTPKEAQKYLLERLYLKRWYGVIVMTVSISQQADRMLKLMKRKIDDLVSQDQHLQSFLTWVNQQSIQIQTPYKAVTIRALYLDIDLENTRSLDRARALDIAHSRSLERARTKAMGIDNTMATEVDIDYTINLALNLDLALYFASHPVLELASTLEPDLNKGLQYLRQKFPDPYKNRSTFATWWQANGLDWSKKLRNLIVQHRKSSQEWQFSENQLKVLRTYHDANKLLIECLNNAEYVSPLVKSQIESTLLLPQGEYSILQY